MGAQRVTAVARDVALGLARARGALGLTKMSQDLASTGETALKQAGWFQPEGRFGDGQAVLKQPSTKSGV